MHILREQNLSIQPITYSFERHFRYRDLRKPTQYQDFRLYTVNRVEDTTVCNNEKLESGSTAMYVRSCKHFLDWVIFQEGIDWPTVIFTPSNMVDDENAPNVPIEVRGHTSDLT